MIEIDLCRETGLKRWRLPTVGLRVVLGLWACVYLVGCGAKFLKVDNSKTDDLTTIEEYDQLVKVKQIGGAPLPSPVSGATGSPTVFPSALPLVSPAGEPTVSPSPAVLPGLPQPTPSLSPLIKEKKSKTKVAKPPVVKTLKVSPAPSPQTTGPRQPEIEDSEGFTGRRPNQDPFRPGEKSVLKLSYFNIAAGELSIEVLPFVEVNGRKAYHFQLVLKSYAMFSSFYSVDDSAETFLDFEKLIPFNFAIHVKESKQLREVRSFMDWEKMEARFWEKKITKESGVETRNLRWDILPYTQNVITAAYYLRTFTWRPGKSVQFRVADDGKNMVVKGEVVRREVLETSVGKFPALVLKPEIAIEGVFKPMGDIFFWLTDDDRKQIIRIESKIRIGKIVGELKELSRGQVP